MPPNRAAPKKKVVAEAAANCRLRNRQHLDQRGDLGAQGVPHEGGDQRRRRGGRDEHAGGRALAGLGQAVDEQAEAGRQQAQAERRRACRPRLGLLVAGQDT